MIKINRKRFSADRNYFEYSCKRTLNTRHFFFENEHAMINISNIYQLHVNRNTFTSYSTEIQTEFINVFQLYCKVFIIEQEFEYNFNFLITSFSVYFLITPVLTSHTNPNGGALLQIL